MRPALKYSPLQIGIRYAGLSQAVNGVIPRQEGTLNHAVTLLHIDEEGRYYIFDHYQGNVFKILASDYIIGSAMAHHIKDNSLSIPKPMANIPENLKKGTHLVQNVEGDGSFAVVIDGTMYVDDLTKVLATYLTRTGGSGLPKDVWSAFIKKNLKGEIMI